MCEHTQSEIFLKNNKSNLKFKFYFNYTCNISVHLSSMYKIQRLIHRQAGNNLKQSVTQFVSVNK